MPELLTQIDELLGRWNRFKTHFADNMEQIALNNSINPVSSQYVLLIVATYNCAETLSRCLDSFISQTYPHKKLVVIDGGSTDGTVDIIRRYKNHIDHWVSEPDRGIYHAWNNALSCTVKWDWVQFMGGDDYYFDDRVLERVALHLENIFPDYCLAYARTEVLHPNGEKDFLGQSWDIDRIRSEGRFPSGQISFFYRSSIFEQYGHFNESFKIAGDLEHFFRLIEREAAYYISDVISSVHRIGGVSTDPSLDLLHMHERERAFQTHGYIHQKSLAYYYILSIRLLKHWVYRSFGDRVLQHMVHMVRRFSGGRKLSLRVPVKRGNTFS